MNIVIKHGLGAGLALLLLASCHDSHGASARDSNTNWLVVCERNDQCTGDARCLCGVCTRACTSSADCTEVAEDTECVDVDAPGLADRCAEDLTGAVCWRGPAGPGGELGVDAADDAQVDGSIMSTLDGSLGDAGDSRLDADVERADAGDLDAASFDASDDGGDPRTSPEDASVDGSTAQSACPLCLNRVESECGRRVECACPEGVTGADCSTIHPVRQVVVGLQHTCALLAPSRVKCWGDNRRGQLGVGDTETRGDAPGEMGASLPAIDFGTDTFIDRLASGDEHTCALFVDRTVRCWGANVVGQLGRGDTSSYGDEPGEMGEALEPLLGGALRPVILSVGADHTCALLPTQQVACWGGNRFGQLGRGDTLARGDAPDELVLSEWIVDLGDFAVENLVAGRAITCATRGSDVKCWGSNSRGQLAQGDTQHRGDEPGELGDALAPARLGSFPTGYRTIVAGGQFACVLLPDSARCWGANDSGQLLLGITDDRGDSADELGAGLLTAVLDRVPISIAAGSTHACALLEVPSGFGSEVACWGGNGLGALGLGDREPRGDEPLELGANLPRVSLPGRVTSLAATQHTCAVVDHEAIVCWGSNERGQLGQGNTDNYGDDPGELPSALPPVSL